MNNCVLSRRLKLILETKMFAYRLNHCLFFVRWRYYNYDLALLHLGTRFIFLSMSVCLLICSPKIKLICSLNFNRPWQQTSSKANTKKKRRKSTNLCWKYWGWDPVKNDKYFKKVLIKKLTHLRNTVENRFNKSKCLDDVKICIF